MSYFSKQCLNELPSKNKKYNPKTIVVDKSFENIKNGDQYDIFISYSYSDKDFALIIYALLVERGFSVYIDLKDDSLNRNNVNGKTAKRLAKIMDESRSLIYVHTPSAKESRWCPWELGYMSAKRKFRCAIIPLIKDNEEFPSQEYLDLYPFVDYEIDGNTNKFVFWAKEYDSGKYIGLKEFANGSRQWKDKES